MSERFLETLRDELLVLRTQQGETQALDELVARWHQPLLRYAVRLTGDAEAGLDAVQETWLAVIKSLVRLKDVTRFRVWLYQVLTNKCTDRHREQARSRRLIEEAADHARNGAARQEPGELWELVGKLKPESRAVLTLMYADSFSVGEIAEVLGVPEGTVKSRLHYARQEVRRAMERD